MGKRLLEMTGRTFVQGVLTLIIVLTVCCMAVTGRELPLWLVQTLFVVLGVWFGSVTAAVINDRQNNAVKHRED